MKKPIKFAIPCILLISLSCTNHKVVKEYYLDGVIKSETEVNNGLRNGISKTYDERGRLKSTAVFVNDMYEGWMTTFNPKNGKVAAKALYKNDKQNGPVTLYYDEGQLYREEFYKEGRVDSIVKTYWPDGKLQAEVYFNMGAPGLGLKEYDEQGNAVKHPDILIKEINDLRSSNTFKLKIYLTDKNAQVDYYLGDLVENKYLDPDAIKVKDNDGVAFLQYNVQKNHRVGKVLGISARIRTGYGNTLLLHKVYNLKISN
jgi:hypothetical protein